MNAMIFELKNFLFSIKKFSLFLLFSKPKILVYICSVKLENL